MFFLESVVVGLKMWSETEFSGKEDLLSTWELDLFIAGSARHKNLTDCYSCGFTESLTEDTSHTLLESICTSAGKHFVNSNHMPWVDSDSHVEILFTTVDSHVLVTGNSGGFKSFGGDLLLLVANKMDT